MSAFLVTGNPGSGKSTVARELTRRGFAAIDPDFDPELSHWEGPGGTRVMLADGPVDPDREWLQAHRWVWNRARMEQVVEMASNPVFVCGIALNIEGVLDLFARLFLLRIDEATQEERLGAHDVMNPPGRTEAGRQQIREGRVAFESEMIALGAITIDAVRPPSLIVDGILMHTSSA